MDPYFDHPGVPITVAAGDTGDVVTYPAATPYVISVGGTDWNAQRTGGDGPKPFGGAKAKKAQAAAAALYEPKPAWQTDTACAKRTDNDVAAVGSPGTPVWTA